MRGIQVRYILSGVLIFLFALTLPCLAEMSSTQKSAPTTNTLEKHLPAQKKFQRKKSNDITTAKATIEKQILEWNKEKSNILRNLAEVGRNSRLKPAAESFQREFDSVDKTLVDARRITDQENPNIKQIDTVVSRLKRHRQKMWNIHDNMKRIEQEQEVVRNKRRTASTAFQNFDQKANQLYNLLSSVMKAMNEMRMGTVRNML